jgi:hypothetical protein
MNKQKIIGIVKKLTELNILALLVVTLLITTKNAWLYFGFEGATISFLMMLCFALLLTASMLRGSLSFQTIFYSSVLIVLACVINRADLLIRPANNAPQIYREYVMKEIERGSREIIGRYSGYSKLEVSTENGPKLFGVDIRGTVPTLSIALEFHKKFIARFPELDPNNIYWDVTLKSTNERLRGRDNVFERFPNDGITNAEGRRNW